MKGSGGRFWLNQPNRILTKDKPRGSAITCKMVTDKEPEQIWWQEVEF